MVKGPSARSVSDGPGGKPPFSHPTESLLPTRKSFSQSRSTSASPSRTDFLSPTPKKDLPSPAASFNLSDVERKPRNVLKRKTSTSLRSATHPPANSLKPSQRLATYGHTSPASGNGVSLTPAGAVAQAYKMQERHNSNEQVPKHVFHANVNGTTPTRRSSWESDEEEGKNVMPYYTVLGSTSGRVVAVGSPADSTPWFPVETTSTVGLKRNASTKAKDEPRAARSVPPSLCKTTATASLSPSSPSTPSRSPTSASSNTGGGGKLWKLMKRVSTGGLRDKYNQRPDEEAPPVPKLPSSISPVEQLRHTPSLEVTSPYAKQQPVYGSRTVSESGHDVTPTRSRTKSIKRVPAPKADESLLVEPGYGSGSSPIRRMDDYRRHRAVLPEEDEGFTLIGTPPSGSPHKSKPSSRDRHHRPITLNIGASSSHSSLNSSSSNLAKRPNTMMGPTPNRTPSLKKSASASVTSVRIHHHQPPPPPPANRSRDPSPYRHPNTSSSNMGASRQSTSSSRPSLTAPSLATTLGYANSSRTSIDSPSCSRSDHSHTTTPLGRSIVSARDRSRMEAEFNAMSSSIESSGHVSEPDIRTIKKHSKERERVEQERVTTNLPPPPRHRHRPLENDRQKDQDHAKRGAEEEGHLERERKTRDRGKDVSLERPESPLIPSFSVESAINTFGPRTKIENGANATAAFPPAHGTTDNNGEPGRGSTSSKSIKRRPSLKSLLLPSPSLTSNMSPSHKRSPTMIPSSSSGSGSGSSNPPARPSRSPARPPPPGVTHGRRLVSASGPDTPSRQLSLVSTQNATLRPDAAEKFSRTRPRSNSMGLPSLNTTRNNLNTRPAIRQTSKDSFTVDLPGGGPKSATPSVFNFRKLDGNIGRKLTEAEKAKRWEDLLERSAAAGGTLHLGSGSLEGEHLESDDL